MGRSRLASIKLSAELVEEARRDAALFQRSIGGQVEHWARLGKAIEAAPGMTLARVRAALAGRLDAESLEIEERETFEDLLFRAPSPEAEAYFEQLRREGGGVGYDAEGRLVRGLPGGGEEVIAQAPAGDR